MPLKTLYIIFQVIGLVIILVEFLYVSMQKPSKIQKFLVVILFALVIAFVAYIIELNGKTIEASMIGCALGYMSKPFALLALLFMLFEYSNIHLKKWIYISVIVYFMILSGIVITNNFHHLYYPTIGFDINRTGSPLVLGHGIFWYIYMISTFVIFAAYLIVIIYEFKFSKTKQAREMTAWLFGVAFFGALGLALFIFGLTNGYESTLLGIVFSSLCAIVLFTKYKIFDTLTLAKDKFLNESVDGLVILDAKDNIKYYNIVASNIIPGIKKFYNHKGENEIVNLINDSYEDDKIYNFNDQIYRFNTATIYSNKGDIIVGKKYIFNNVTDLVNKQQELSKKVEMATFQLRKFNKEIIVSFANLVEARDGFTGVHVKNVSIYSKEIAKSLRNNEKYKDIIDDEFIMKIEECSPLHDVGKIQVPDAILGKPGKLTNEEFNEMRKHAKYGADIIESSMSNIEDKETLQMCKDIALCHHEWYDGSGYPNKLSKDNIPLSARIVAVADVYDALRMRRPYKEPFSKEKSIGIMIDENKRHFDPDVMDAFLKIVDSLVTTYDE